jgi:tetratricopeptide (TPR) repeat protein
MTLSRDNPVPPRPQGSRTPAQPGVPTAADFILEAARLFREGDVPAVIDQLLAGRRVHPESPAILEHLGLCYRAIEEWALCRRALDAARKRKAFSVEGDIARGEALHKLGRETWAVELLESLLNRPGLTRFQLADLARTLGSVGRDSAALAACRRIIRLRPDDADAHHGAAVYLHRLGRDPAAALRYARKAVELAPDRPAFLGFLATLLDRHGRPAEAREVLSRIPEHRLLCPTLRALRRRLDAAGA